MTTLTVICDECEEQVDGILTAETLPNGDPIIMTGGFRLYDSGVSCDDCVGDDPATED